MVVFSSEMRGCVCVLDHLPRPAPAANSHALFFLEQLCVH